MGPSNPDEPLHSQPVQQQTAATSLEPALSCARLSHLHLAAPKPTTTQLNRTASRRQGPVIRTTVRQCRTVIRGPLTAPAGGCDCSPASTTRAVSRILDSPHQFGVCRWRSSPDGRLLGQRQPGRRPDDPAVEPQTGEEIRTLTDHPGLARAVTFSPDCLLFASSGLKIYLWGVACTPSGN